MDDGTTQMWRDHQPLTIRSGQAISQYHIKLHMHGEPIATVSASGEIHIDWPAVEKAALWPLEDGNQVAFIARLLVFARDAGRK